MWEKLAYYKIGFEETEFVDEKRIKNGESRPEDPVLTLKYRDRWFRRNFFYAGPKVIIFCFSKIIRNNAAGAKRKNEILSIMTICHFKKSLLIEWPSRVTGRKIQAWLKNLNPSNWAQDSGLVELYKAR